jgi:hypothetical protein
MLTRSALLLALCVAVQQFKTLSQFITGPLVNAILIISVLYIGLWSGITIAVLSPVFALIINPSPILQLVPQMTVVIAIANILIVLGTYLLKNKNLILGLVAGSVAKTAALWAGISLVVIPVFGAALKAPQKAALSAMFSYNQLITALIGSALAYLIWLKLKKAVEPADQN